MGAVTANVSEPEEELEAAPQHFEEGVTVTTEHLLEIDFGDAGQKRPIFIGTGLSEIEQRDLIQLLTDYRDCLLGLMMKCLVWHVKSLTGSV